MDSLAKLQSAITELQKGNLDLCEGLVDETLGEASNLSAAWVLKGMLAKRRGRSTDALGFYRAAMGCDANGADGPRNLANTLLELGRAREAVKALEEWLSGRQGNETTRVLLARSYAAAGRVEEARDLCKRLVREVVFSSQDLIEVGNVLFQSGDYPAAVLVYRTAIEKEPESHAAWFNLAQAEKRAGNLPAADSAMQRAVALSPSDWKGRVWLANLSETTGNLNKALLQLQAALAVRWDSGLAARERQMLVRLRRYEEAMRAFDAAKTGSVLSAMDRLLHAALKLRNIEWDGIATVCADALGAALAESSPETAPVPFPALSFPIPVDEAAHLVLAKRTAAHFDRPQLSRIRPELKPRLRIAYASSDFHDHATLHLMAGLFKRHDRTRFEVFAYSWGPDDGSEYRRRVEKEVDVFVDVRQMTSEQIAARIRCDGIDILIDLKGYTGDAMPDIFSRRPAPLQIQYLGYPGSMGMRSIDYILVDRIVVPPSQQSHYSERLAYLPHCYQVNDNEQSISEPRPSREECGLPKNGTVYASFCAHNKIDPLVFDTWADVLKSVDGSVLWLLAGSSLQERNLRREAERRGVAPDRLVFAPSLPKATHLSRLRNADLFLDTLWYNGHTTASDALWAGVPVLTLPGNTFASRVGASLVTAVGMPDMIATDLSAYRRVAIGIGRSAARIEELKRELAINRLSFPLFDTGRFAADIDNLLWILWQRACQDAVAEGEDERGLGYEHARSLSTGKSGQNRAPCV